MTGGGNATEWEVLLEHTSVTLQLRQAAMKQQMSVLAGGLQKALRV